MLQQVTTSNTLLQLKSSIPMGIVQYTQGRLFGMRPKAQICHGTALPNRS
jgi:hypothetical protein